MTVVLSFANECNLVRAAAVSTHQPAGLPRKLETDRSRCRWTSRIFDDVFIPDTEFHVWAMTREIRRQSRFYPSFPFHPPLPGFQRIAAFAIDEVTYKLLWSVSRAFSRMLSPLAWRLTPPPRISIAATFSPQTDVAIFYRKGNVANVGLDVLNLPSVNSFAGKFSLRLSPFLVS